MAMEQTFSCQLQFLPCFRSVQLFENTSDFTTLMRQCKFQELQLSLEEKQY
jgi:hypothetical protein